MVVTDDQGRYVVPDLPTPNISVDARLWPRRFPEGRRRAGQAAEPAGGAGTERGGAARYYPAIYWFSMLHVPDASQFGGKSDIPEKITQSGMAVG